MPSSQQNIYKGQVGTDRNNIMKMNTTLSVIVCILCVSYCHTSRANGTETNAQKNQVPLDNFKQLNVLVMAMPASGHTSVPLALGEELVRRGHNVTLVTSGYKYRSNTEQANITYKSNGYSYGLVDLAKANQGNIMKVLINHMPKFLRNETSNFLQYFKEENVSRETWDVVISTEVLQTLLACVSNQWKIPVVMTSTTTQIQPHTYPPWPWASAITGSFTDDLKFYQRFMSAIEKTLYPTLYSYLFVSSVKTTIAGFCPEASQSYLSNAPGVHIPNIVPTVIGFEYPRTMLPLVHYVGPITSKNPEPAYDVLQTWLDKKDDKTVVYISMGSIASLSQEAAEAIMNGILKSNYSAVWAMRKNSEFDFNVDPKRFFIAEWLPQLSVLRHPAISMAIMHGGMNGIHEALSNGLPLILLPGQSEQVANSGKVQHQGLGLYLDKEMIDSEIIAQSIGKIDSGNYRQKVRNLQKMFAQAGGVEKAADLVEFYAEIGYDHLIPAYAKYNWSWIQYYNVDVYMVFLVIVLVVASVVLKLIQKCRRCLSKKLKTD